METGIIILAAGNSSRLGKPKQLLTYKGKTLLGIVSDSALETTFKPIIVVLGAYAEEISTEHHHPNINYIINDNWENGMAWSISSGISAMLNLNPNLENVIIAVADQVFINAEVFEMLEKKHEQTSKGIIASKYAETIGTPCLFNKKYFHQLSSLSGNNGAKEILKYYANDTEIIPFEAGVIDIDTEMDYNNLMINE